MKRAVILLFAMIHIVVIIYSNIIIEEQTITYYYKHKKEAGKAMTLLERLPWLNNAFDFYGHYTGAGTGYGFYAPSVSNQVIFMFTVVDKNNRPIFTDQLPFHTREAYIRSIRIGGDFLKRSKDKHDLENQYMNALVKSMALWTLDTHPGGHKVMADLLLYNVPTNFNDIRNNKKANYIKLEHYEYSL